MPDGLRLDFQFPAHLRFFHRYLVKKLARSFETYQPVFIGENRIGTGARASVDRWVLIQKVIQNTGAKSLVDLGCAEGYFVQMAARHGCVALGIDADVRRLTVAQNTSILNGIDGAGFLYGRITESLVRKMPVFDVVLLLSVLHHVMYEHGVDKAKALISAVRERTRLGLVFDMGQSNETVHEWAALLPRMDPDPETWIARFLSDLGFSKVSVIGVSDAYENSVRRALFFCEP
jgi:SAM-dependent methyltransferase